MPELQAALVEQLAASMASNQIGMVLDRAASAGLQELELLALQRCSTLVVSCDGKLCRGQEGVWVEAEVKMLPAHGQVWLHEAGPLALAVGSSAPAALLYTSEGDSRSGEFVHSASKCVMLALCMYLAFITSRSLPEPAVPYPADQARLFHRLHS